MNPRVNLRNRQRASSQGILLNNFEAAGLELLAAFKRSEPFKHAQTMGNEREVPVRKVIADNLPHCYRAVTGEIVDIKNNKSGQIDAIIYNCHRNSAFVSGNSHIVPAEAPLVTIEVKSRLTRAEVVKSIRSAAQLKTLKPLGSAVRRTRTGGDQFDGKFRYFHCIFAYNTDLVQAGWDKSEYRRFVECCAEAGQNADVIDRVYVADRGLIMPSKGLSLEETSATGFGLMQLILHIRSFCLREDARRPAVDYDNYASAATDRWKPCT